jgi:hypothetical protein
MVHAAMLVQQKLDAAAGGPERWEQLDEATRERSVRDLGVAMDQLQEWLEDAPAMLGPPRPERIAELWPACRAALQRMSPADVVDFEAMLQAAGIL